MARAEARDALVSPSAAEAADVVRLYEPVIAEVVTLVFERLPVSEATQRGIRHLLTLLLHKDWLSRNATGVVVAGFGRGEYFPSLVQYEVDGFFGGHLRLATRNVINNANAEDPSELPAIVPFAQREVLDTFVSGYDPYLQRLTGSFIESALKQLLDRVSPDYPERETLVNEIVNGFREQLSDVMQDRHVEPTLAAVEVLPLDELAALAEALVNLTSLKQKVSLDLETVGGPIDVAVISRGDGFIWIRRKHYFQAELNPQFFANYYRPWRGNEG